MAQRQSVFDRLGPMKGDDAEPRRRQSVFERLGRLPDDDASAPAQARRRGRGGRGRGGNAGQHQTQSSTLEDNHYNPKPSGLPRAPKVVLCHRTADGSLEVKQNPTDKIPATAATSGDSAALLELQRKLSEMEKSRTEAQDLADALLASHQALLAEKSKIQAEKEQLARESMALAEQVEYLQIVTQTTVMGATGLPHEHHHHHDHDGTDSLTSPQAYSCSAAHTADEPPITPDSAMLRALMADMTLNGGGGGGGGDINVDVGQGEVSSRLLSVMSAAGAVAVAVAGQEDVGDDGGASVLSPLANTVAALKLDSPSSSSHSGAAAEGVDDVTEGDANANQEEEEETL